MSRWAKIVSRLMRVVEGEGVSWRGGVQSRHGLESIVVDSEKCAFKVDR